MENSLTTSLVITAIGMSLLFLSLVLFYGILSLLTAVTRERPSAVPLQELEEHAPENRALQAAAIAITLARVEAAPGTGMDGAAAAPASEGDLTPWWSLHHQQRLAADEKLRRFG